MGNQVSTSGKKQTGAIVRPTNDTYVGKISEFKQKALRAVVIGCDYTTTDYALGGCVNDANGFHDFLRKRGFGRNAQILCLNDKRDKKYWPTHDNILKAIVWLASKDTIGEFSSKSTFESKAADGTTLVFYFAGHGTQQLDLDGDEEDGRDECLCTINVDGTFGPNLSDDEIRLTMAPLIRPGLFTIFITDCCHSGTVVDLKYKLEGKTFKRDNNYEDTRGNVVHFGACFDLQTAKEGAVDNGQNHGFFTFSFMNALGTSKYTIGGLYDKCCGLMVKYVSNQSQLPQVSTGNSSVGYSTVLPL
jgi:hypothetical protein